MVFLFIVGLNLQQLAWGGRMKFDQTTYFLQRAVPAFAFLPAFASRWEDEIFKAQPHFRNVFYKYFMATLGTLSGPGAFPVLVSSAPA